VHIMKWLYEIMYRYLFVPIPYDVGPRQDLVRLVENWLAGRG
jgi:hypothetical protein